MSKSIKIALIDDDPSISTMYRLSFEAEPSFEVKLAHDGQEGVELVRSYHPDIVLLDMMMPNMSGLDALRYIRELPNGNDIKIITLTNMNDPEIIKEIAAYNVISHIVKADKTPRDIINIVKLATSQ